MITASETDLTASEYSGLTAATTNARWAVTMQRINWVFTSYDEQSPRATDFDVALVPTSERFVRAYRTTGDTLYIESWNGSSWDTEASQVSTDDVEPTLAAAGSVISCFYARADNIRRRASVDGGVTWSGEETVGPLSNMAHLAATEPSHVHAVTYDNYNSHLYSYDYEASWAQTESDVYYPYSFDSFDAEAIDNKDVIVFAATGPTRYETRRQGIWVMREKNGQWSELEEIDVLDEYSVGEDQRISIRLSQFNSRLYGTFISQDGAYVGTCYTSSATGHYWEHRQPIGNSISWEGKLLLRGDYVYLIDAESMYRSASTVISGNSTVELSLTKRVADYGIDRTDMWQSRFVLHNEDEALASYMDAFDRYQLKEELGYVVNGAKVVQQVALTEMDTIDRSSDLPEDTVQLTARDRLSWMRDRTQADHYEEWESQLVHHDDYENTVDENTDHEVLNTGLRHTAGMEGNWTTESNRLKLASNNSEGTAFCSISKFIGHVFVQEGVRVPTEDNDEWAGVIFRAQDEDNYWQAYYDEETDTIKLRRKLAGEYEAAVATSGAISYTVDTWLYLRVEAWLSLFTVYYCTDGATWTQAFQYIDTTSRETADPFMEGYVGHGGYGYSDEDVEPDEPDPYGSEEAEDPLDGREMDDPGPSEIDMQIVYYGGFRWTLAFQNEGTWYPALPGYQWAGDADQLAFGNARAEKLSTGTEYIYVAGAVDGDTQWTYKRNGIWRRAAPLTDHVGLSYMVTASELAYSGGVDYIAEPSMYSYSIANLAVSAQQDGWQWCVWWVLDTGTVPTGEIEAAYGVAHTRDGWQTVYRNVMLASHDKEDWSPTKEAYTYIAGGLEIDQHSDGQRVYLSIGLEVATGDVFAQSYEYDAYLYKSLNYGATFYQVDTIADKYDVCNIHVPSADPLSDTIYWSAGEILRRSKNGGGSFHDIATGMAAVAYDDIVDLSGPLDDADIVTICRTKDVYEWDAGTLTQLLAYGDAARDYKQGMLVLERDTSGHATKILTVAVDMGGVRELCCIEDATEIAIEQSGNAVAMDAFIESELGEWSRE